MKKLKSDAMSASHCQSVSAFEVRLKINVHLKYLLPRWNTKYLNTMSNTSVSQHLLFANGVCVQDTIQDKAISM